MTDQQRPSLRCNHCLCIITQDEADRAARLFVHADGTLCPACAKSLADDLAGAYDDSANVPAK